MIHYKPCLLKNSGAGCDASSRSEENFLAVSVRVLHNESANMNYTLPQIRRIITTHNYR